MQERIGGLECNCVLMGCICVGTALMGSEEESPLGMGGTDEE
jgi:hypothetical protein